MSGKVTEFFKNAFQDMKESAKEQHEVDKTNFAAAKAESKVQFAKAKAMSDPLYTKEKMKAERKAQIAKANERVARAEESVKI